eukprot:1384336-Amorphochlora_amoeboformis.AAC.1
MLLIVHRSRQPPFQDVFGPTVGEFSFGNPPEIHGLHYRGDFRGFPDTTWSWRPSGDTHRRASRLLEARKIGDQKAIAIVSENPEGDSEGKMGRRREEIEFTSLSEIKSLTNGDEEEALGAEESNGRLTGQRSRVRSQDHSDSSRFLRWDVSKS